eukprot:3518743-Pleurochrysis_carterae.AAC.4
MASYDTHQDADKDIVCRSCNALFTACGQTERGKTARVIVISNDSLLVTKCFVSVHAFVRIF